VREFETNSRFYMGHHHVSNRIHCVFATHDRRAMIAPAVQSRLWAYMAGTARAIGLESMAVGGHVEHVHMLFALPASMRLSEAVQKVKANSSRWMKEQGSRLFSWQEGYSAFSVSVSGADRTIAYIRAQAEHHARKTFDDEIAAILRKHGINE
jgi:putative transposase